jgi:hypothetical protein
MVYITVSVLTIRGVDSIIGKCDDRNHNGDPYIEGKVAGVMMQVK